jgi:hypothetical protein
MIGWRILKRAPMRLSHRAEKFKVPLQVGAGPPKKQTPPPSPTTGCPSLQGRTGGILIKGPTLPGTYRRDFDQGTYFARAVARTNFTRTPPAALHPPVVVVSLLKAAPKKKKKVLQQRVRRLMPEARSLPRR